MIPVSRLRLQKFDRSLGVGGGDGVGLDDEGMLLESLSTAGRAFEEGVRGSRTLAEVVKLGRGR